MDKNEIIEYAIPFKLFECCVLVKGYSRSTINDLNRASYYIIPNELYELLTFFDGKTINEVIDCKRYLSKNVLEYFKFLYSNELIFYTTTPRLFPKINFTKWKLPSHAYQAIIDISDDIEIINQSVFEGLDKLNCKYLQLRFYSDMKYFDLKSMLEKMEETSIVGIDIYLKYISQGELKKIQVLLNSFFRVNNVFVYNSPETKHYSLMGPSSGVNISLVKENISNCKSCGIVSANYFNINIDLYTKSINSNSCLNGKISIDVNGDIKNCPSLKENFGNIRNTSLEAALNKKEFKKYWNITKDEIDICKDCEFRHMCTDCRAYVENPSDVNSKPLKCGYDPYKCEWHDWAIDPQKQKAIQFYEM